MEEELESVEVAPEISPMSKKHVHKDHAFLGHFRAMNIDRIGECEIKHVDPNVEICHNPPTHVVRQLSIVVCAGHTAAVEAIFQEQVGAVEEERKAYEKKSQEKGAETQTGSIAIPAVPGAEAAS